MTVVVGSSQLLSPMTLDWEFDEGSGTVVHDGSGLGHDGVLAGNPLWVSNGVTGGALSFSGTNDWVVQTNGGNVLEGHDQFTLSLCVYLSGTTWIGESSRPAPTEAPRFRSRRARWPPAAIIPT